MTTLLAVSPHLDDAIFSLGALLARRAAAGDRIVVATCFTGSVPNPTGFALACQLDKGLAADVDYMALRRAEDVEACAAIGAEPVHLPLLEAPHRGYNSAGALFASVRSDDHAAAEVTEQLLPLIASMRPDLILAPYCLGGHVDHVAVRRAVGAAAHCPLLLWADMPYATRLADLPPDGGAHPCGDWLGAKLTACAAYRSQVEFQFGGAPRRDTVTVDAAEWLWLAQASDRRAAA